jgi:hypothetical protein
MSKADPCTASLHGECGAWQHMRQHQGTTVCPVSAKAQCAEGVLYTRWAEMHRILKFGRVARSGIMRPMYARCFGVCIR